jgi:hypothetical protein
MPVRVPSQQESAEPLVLPFIIHSCQKSDEHLLSLLLLLKSVPNLLDQKSGASIEVEGINSVDRSCVVLEEKGESARYPFSPSRVLLALPNRFIINLALASTGK